MSNPPPESEPAAATAAAEREAVAHDPIAALRIPSFCLFLTGNLLTALGYQMQVVAVGYEIYERTHKPLFLGLAGLVEFLPVLLLTLPAGHVVDRLPRRLILVCTASTIGLAACLMAALSYWQFPVPLLFIGLLIIGGARAFQQPAKASLVPLIVPRARFSNAVTWSTGGFQVAAAAGPATCGLLLARYQSPALVYLLHGCGAFCFVLLLLGVRHERQVMSTESLTMQSLAAGLRFVWGKKVMLAALSLDMFAVLLGGAVTLLPIYAEDILQVGPSGLGWMRAAPAVGALVMSLLLAMRPLMTNAGQKMVWSVVGWGLATIVFGLSRSFALSMAMLFLMGALDNISVIIRHTLVQLLTPDEMRGRVSAVNSVFIGASNELGGFESGAVATLLGPVLAVVTGGLGTLAVVASIAWTWPELLRYGRLGSDLHDDPPAH